MSVSAAGTVVAMSGPDDRPARFGGARGAGRLLLYGALGLAVAAAAVLAVGSEDARLLRLGVLAALWAALLGAFAAVRMRREVAAGADRAEDLRAIYHLELEREVAARREHELSVERELRRQVEKESRDELDALRAELRTLRQNLQQLLGGEVLVERVALRAESTRVRSLPEPSGTPNRVVDLPRRPSRTPNRVLAGPREPAPAGTASGSRASAESPAAGPVRNGHSAPPAAEPGPASPPLPRRDPAVRTDFTPRRPPPETAPPPRRTPSFAEDPLFGEAPQRSSPAWTPSWPSAPTQRDPQPTEPPRRQQPAARHEHTGLSRELSAAEGRHHGAASWRPERAGSENGAARGNGAARPGGRRQAPEAPPGTHSGGRPVEELLAAYGGDHGPRRRRRRDE